MYIIFNAGEDGHITAVMLAISEIIQWYSLDCDIKPNKIAENKVWEILTVVNVFSNPFIAFQYYCNIWVRHWTHGALIMPTFMKPSLNAQPPNLIKVQWWEPLS